jgi:hypothetical protein
MITAPVFAQITARLASEGTPNIDCWSADADDIWSLAEVLSRPRQSGLVMFPDRRKGYVRATQSLAHYAYNKATAMRCRARGDVLGAGNYEAICQRIYDRLPAFARW